MLPRSLVLVQRRYPLYYWQRATEGTGAKGVQRTDRNQNRHQRNNEERLQQVCNLDPVTVTGTHLVKYLLCISDKCDAKSINKSLCLWCGVISVWSHGHLIEFVVLLLLRCYYCTCECCSPVLLKSCQQHLFVGMASPSVVPSHLC